MPRQDPKKSVEVLMEDRRRRSVAFENLAKEVLRYLDNSENVNVGIARTAGSLGKSIFSVRQSGPAGDERKWPKVSSFLAREKKSCVASWARWNAQLKGGIETRGHEAGDTSIE